MVPLLACMKAGETFPNTAKEALRALGAAAQHKAFGLVLLKTQGAVRACRKCSSAVAVKFPSRPSIGLSLFSKSSETLASSLDGREGGPGMAHSYLVSVMIFCIPIGVYFRPNRRYCRSLLIFWQRRRPEVLSRLPQQIRQEVLRCLWGRSRRPFIFCNGTTKW